MDSADFAVAEVSGGKYRFKNKMRMGRLYRHGPGCKRALILVGYESLIGRLDFWFG
jgi:hypothetical protein